MSSRLLLTVSLEMSCSGLKNLVLLCLALQAATNVDGNFSLDCYSQTCALTNIIGYISYIYNLHITCLTYLSYNCIFICKLKNEYVCFQLHKSYSKVLCIIRYICTSEFEIATLQVHIQIRSGIPDLDSERK